MYSFDNVPDELKSLRQWIVWRAVFMPETGKTTKIPLQVNGWPASVTNQEHWATFQAATAAFLANPKQCSGVGFVFTARDPYCGIDLDETNEGSEERARQIKVFEAINSYTEWSPSGKGLHIITRAYVPQGRKRAHIEIYSQDRYFTFTGNVYRPLPISECNQVVNQLWEQMGKSATADYYAGADYETNNDLRVIERAEAATNSDLFKKLWQGDWHSESYPSQSEADQALMNILAVYCENRLQLMRLFRMSALGQRDKAKRDAYLNYTINKAFDLKLPPIDMSGLLRQAEEVCQRTQEIAAQPAQELIDKAYAWQTPPTQMIADIFNFMMGQSKYPVAEMSLTATISMLAGICGRAYNVSHTGLNQYIMLLAETGRGKEAMATGINALFSAIAQTEFPEIWQFMGPSDIASGAALLKFLSNEEQPPCFLSITGEVGIRLQQISSPNAHVGDSTLRSRLLDLYGKSGMHNMTQKTIYSDQKNNTAAIRAPAFTWLGESTQVEFYKSLDIGQIASGLLPRFMIVEYKGPRVKPNAHMNNHPDPALVLKVRELASLCRDHMAQQQAVDVGMTYDGAMFARDLEKKIDNAMNTNDDGPYVQLLNREYLKTIKLAAIAAITENFFRPLVEPRHLEWAYAIVARGTMIISSRFEAGDVGTMTVEDAKQYHDMTHWLLRYQMGKVSLDSNDLDLQKRSVVSYRCMQMTLGKLASFRKDRQGSKFALNRAIDDAMRTGVLQECRPAQIGRDNGRFYAINSLLLPREAI